MRNLTFCVLLHLLCLGSVFFCGSCDDDDSNGSVNVYASLQSSQDDSVIINLSYVMTKDYHCWYEAGVCFSRSNPLPTRKDSFICAGTSMLEDLEEEKSFTVSVNGVQHGGTYFYRAYAIFDNDIYYSDASTFTIDIHQDSALVDLGLSVMWSSCNLGAESTDEDGMCFAWGETEPSSQTYKSDYKFYADLKAPILKYCNDESLSTYDGLTVLEPEDDAVTAMLGEGWHIPTKEEWLELMEKCKWCRSDLYRTFRSSKYEVDSLDLDMFGHGPIEFGPSNTIAVGATKGYSVIGPNGNSIFLPCPDRDTDPSIADIDSRLYYWTSSLGSSYSAYSANVEKRIVDQTFTRSFCLKVRPVYNK